MKKVSILLISLICLLKLGLSLKSTDICDFSQIQNITAYDKRSILMCAGEHSFKCTSDYCAVDKKACKEILKMNSFLKSKQTSYSYLKELNHFKAFMANIRKCSFSQQFLRPADFCINGLNCRINSMSRLRNNEHLSKKTVACVCERHHIFKCGHFCTKNESLCNILRNSNRNLLKNFASCNNDNKLYQKRMKIYY